MGIYFSNFDKILKFKIIKIFKIKNFYENLKKIQDEF